LCSEPSNVFLRSQAHLLPRRGNARGAAAKAATGSGSPSGASGSVGRFLIAAQAEPALARSLQRFTQEPTGRRHRLELAQGVQRRRRHFINLPARRSAGIFAGIGAR
jgi:hypothetical protein